MDNSDKSVPLKPPTTFKEQVGILRSRKLIIYDEELAIDVLRRVNYYRLSGYMLSFKEGEVFKDGTPFESIFRVYEFDRKIRNLLTGMLEMIEISMRTYVAYHLGHQYGSLAYQDSTIFQYPSNHASFLTALNKSIDDARKGHELFVEHHDAKYDGKLPVWSVVELLSFSTLSILYANLKPDDRKQIAGVYCGVPAFYLRSWLRSLSHVRNVCAHHARIYNKRFVITPELYPDDKDRMSNSRIFGSIFVIGILCPDASVWSSFETNLEALIDEYLDVVELPRIGFPPDWRDILRDTVTTRRFSAQNYRIRTKLS